MVTDDYLLMVDYLSADKPHQFDCLLHPVGFQGVEGAEKAGELLPAITTNENSPYKYFPSCQWYKANEESVKFQFNDSGIGLDYHIAWPTESDIFYAEYPSTKSAVQGGLRNNPDRRTVGVRVNAKEAVFITLLEPYKGESVIAKVESTSDDKIRIYMKDGSMQIIQISNLKGEAKDVKVEFNRISNRGKVKTEKN